MKLKKNLAHILALALIFLSAYQIATNLQDVFFLVKQIRQQINMDDFKLFLQKGYWLFLGAGMDLTYAMFLIAVPHGAVKLMHLILGIFIFCVSFYLSFMVK